MLCVFCGCGRSPATLRDKYLNSGKQFLQKQDYSRALIEFKNAARVMPKDAEPHYRAGLVYLDTRDVRFKV